MNRKDEVTDWLLEGDAAIRWQAMRDLTDASPGAVERERRKVADEGWGARLLKRQSSDGRWAARHGYDGGLYLPKWISTTYTMLVLRDFGLSPSDMRAKKACALMLDLGLQPDGGVSYGTWAQWTKQGETCITGMALSILSYFEHDDPRLEIIAAHLLDEQMPDGGWNCRRPRGATHSSMNTTISALEGLRFYELFRAQAGADCRIRRTNRGLGTRESALQAVASNDVRRHIRRSQIAATSEAQRRGREFLLAHRLFRSHRTGRVIKSEFLRLSFPPRWHYDILRALDYFRAADAPRDPRLGEAVEILRSKRRPDGRWPLEYTWRGRVHFQMEKVGQPSRWNTLRALRVLKWWDGTR